MNPLPEEDAPQWLKSWFLYVYGHDVAGECADKGKKCDKNKCKRYSDKKKNDKPPNGRAPR
eukprot:scaffold108205_cov75-Phaeocystis_antarctica.AAC.1